MTKEEMTREDAIDILQNGAKYEGDEDFDEKLYEAKQVAVAALKAEPCEDAVSREAVRDMFCEIHCHSKRSKCVFRNICKYMNRVSALPPVTPKPSWIHVSEDSPKESGEYLVSVIDEYDGNYEAVGVARYDVKEGEWQELGVDRTVIAWMPKPKPMKVGE